MTDDEAGRSASIYLIKQLEIAARFRLDQALENSGLSAVQYSLLSQLESHPGSTGADLARRWHLRPQSTNEVILDLERRQLIRRTPNPSHRRQLMISLTSEGTAMLREAHGAVALLDRAIDAALPGGDATRFRKMLKVARRALDELDIGEHDK